MSLVGLDREAVRRGGLHSFLELAWPHVEPGEFQDNWHLREVSTHLEAVIRCDIRRLIVNEPPGCTKSLLLNVMLGAWTWIDHPEFKFIYASFDASLVGKRDGGKLIALLQSQWYLDRWGEKIKQRKPSAYDFDTIAGGFRFSTSPGGKGTGRHGNITILDDPIKPKDAAGNANVDKTVLRAVSDWRANTLATRQADPKTHREILTMQRLNTDDLSGELERTGDFEVLRLPMRYESTYRCVTSIGGDRRTVEGELLFPARFDEAEVKQLEKTLGTHAPAQLQQRPFAVGGNIFKREWWRFWSKGDLNEPCLCETCWKAKRSQHDTGKKCAKLPESGFDIQSWDMAFKGNDTSDFVCGGAWRSYRERYLLGFRNERMGFAASKIAVRRMSVEYPTTAIKLIEDKANGPAIEDDLKKDVPGIQLVNPMGGKESRANAVTATIMAGDVFLPHPYEYPGTWDLLSQCEAFPNGANDDIVDMLTQGLVYLKKHGSNLARALDALRDRR